MERSAGEGARSRSAPDFGIYIEMWARLGARAGEMAALGPEDLDPDTATVPAQLRHTLASWLLSHGAPLLR